MVGDGEPIEGAIVTVDVERVFGASLPPATGVTDPSGASSIDTSGLDLSESVTAPPTLRIIVERDGWFADPVVVPAGAGAVEVSIAMRRVATVVGRALGPDGTPVGASVQALLDEDTPVGGTRTFGVGVVAADDGRFRLPIDGEGPALIAVAWHRARPWTTPATLVRGREIDLGDVRLDRGATLAGRVRASGIPPDRTTVIATWYGPGFDSVRKAQDGRLWVIGRRGIRSQWELRPDAEERFRIDGLEPGPYRLRVSTEDWGYALHPDAYAEVDRIVRSPDERLVVDADRSLLQVDVASGDGPALHASVAIEGRDPMRISCAPDGMARLVVRAGSRHHLVVGAPGFRSTTLDVTVEPGTRRERITLSPAAPATASPDTIDHGEVFLVHVVGPDGLTVAAPFCVIDEHGRPTEATAIDRRGSVSIFSPTHTSWSGPTWFARPNEGVLPTTIEFGGGLFETRRIEIAPSTATTGQTETVELLLHAR